MSSSLKKGVTHAGKTNKSPSVLIVGPYGAGKSTILYTIKHGQGATIVPTIGIDFEKIEINDASIMVFIIGGRSGSRLVWQQYYNRMSALIFVVDSNDRDSIDDVREKLHSIVNEEKLREKPILIFANKQDLPNAMTLDELRDKLDLTKFNTDTKFHLQPASAIQNQGLREGFEWLANCIVEKVDPIEPIVETYNDTITMKNNFMSIFNMDNLKTFLRKLI